MTTTKNDGPEQGAVKCKCGVTEHLNVCDLNLSCEKLLCEKLELQLALKKATKTADSLRTGLGEAWAELGEVRSERDRLALELKAQDAAHNRCINENTKLFAEIDRAKSDHEVLLDDLRGLLNEAEHENVELKKERDKLKGG